MTTPPGPASDDGFWIDSTAHRDWLRMDATRAIDFFRAAKRPEGGFHQLAQDGTPRPDPVQELHATTRMVHSYALAHLGGWPDCEALIDHGMACLQRFHRDAEHGGYLWGVNDAGVVDGRKLAYGHVFVLLAGASAQRVGHPDADALIDDISACLDAQFWDDDAGRFVDEWARDWTPFSAYRGMNANMHGVEALLTAYEVTGREHFLTRAGRIMEFFMRGMAPAHDWRLPEHYDADWQVTPDYEEDPMFRPAATTPGHSFEMGRLMLHHWDLAGRPADDTPQIVRNVVDAALSRAWDPEGGGFFYTLNFDGSPRIRSRYWWPVTEAIGVLASLIKLERRAEDEAWYRRLWQFADAHFVDHARGGWFPEIDAAGRPAETQFQGKPDIYHALQADLFPTLPGLSRYHDALAAEG
ncbi:AGE family epimerase/isomerase [Pseudoponticoccus marisrubri]|nr:AGE family epimerase/isomerase [Pseudoponticoccus marisrubri]